MVVIEVTESTIEQLAEEWLDWQDGIDGGCPFCTDRAFEGLLKVFPPLSGFDIQSLMRKADNAELT